MILKSIYLSIILRISCIPVQSLILQEKRYYHGHTAGTTVIRYYRILSVVLLLLTGGPRIGCDRLLILCSSCSLRSNRHSFSRNHQVFSLLSFLFFLKTSNLKPSRGSKENFKFPPFSSTWKSFILIPLAKMSRNPALPSLSKEKAPVKDEYEKESEEEEDMSDNDTSDEDCLPNKIPFFTLDERRIRS